MTLRCPAGKSLCFQVQRLKALDKNVWGLGAPKTQQSRRTILLEAQVVEALRRHKTQQIVEKLQFKGDYNPLNLVFCSRAGTAINRNNLRNRDFTRTLAKARLDYLNMHAAGRHSTATQAIKAGARLYDVQQQLGHASQSTTADIYAHAQEESSRSIRDTLEQLHAPNPEKLA
jgi:site-specific recombinase XerD